ncbi:AraC family transcriptional regulator [Actinoplanes teichomyceticus]|uniref:AraC family transcriptional regulator n=1 Tax=Actinoplanes teichomyceticus TaxID=1867 RepID=UPI001A513792|nr:helix-turn-helix transcriptional regulator [Actinoplanes teichomyceticus]GIF13994.1 putative transcriptional regulator, AraC family protein [Actinoplanes teichomyceticus]
MERQILTGPTIRPLGHRERIEWHDHDVHQLIHPRQGVLRVSTGRGVWVVPPNRAVWIPAGVPHAHQAHGPTEMRSLIFDVAVRPPGLDEPAVLVVGPLLREVIRTLSDDRDLGDEHRHHLRQVALHQLRRAEALPVLLPAPADPRLARLCDMLAADPADQRSLRELGRQVGAAERTLSRLFRAETGFTFPQWRARLRLHHALHLLAAGQPVTRVAADCGFRSPSAFIEAFRAVFGTTPGRYRNDREAW